MKLNLGSGAAPMKGFINCDRPVTAYGTYPDVACDLRHLPFHARSVDEIHAIHVWEHFERTFECDAVIREWKRVLRTPGLLVLEMPCLDLILQGLQKHFNDTKFYMRGIYGEDYDHRWCWAIDEILAFLTGHGMKHAIRTNPQFHYPTRDMRIEAINS